MKGTKARIVSTDDQIARNLSRRLETQFGYDVSVTERLLEPGRRFDKQRREIVFLDLRRRAPWQDLAQAHAAWLEEEPAGQGGPPIAIVGLTDRGFDFEYAALGDSLLAGVLDVPVADDALAQLLNELSHGEFAVDPARWTAPRTIRGATRNFFSYTPELFPMLDDLALAAKHGFTILLVGDTGSGKTYLARLIHELSDRRDGPFVTVACGSLPRELIDSELFGHVKGAFTSADSTTQGKFDVAEGGTILLDEIDVLGLDQQAKLLRILETGEYEPIGSHDTRRADARTVVASNLSLEELIERDRFRADLYFRLKQVKFDLPPLRKRPRDIVPLAMTMAQECCRETGMSMRQVDPDFLAALKAYRWPGNIRELRNEVRRAVLFCRGDVLTANLLSPAIVAEGERDRPAASVRLASQVAQTEQETIEHMLRAQNFNRAATARALGISRVTLYNKIRKYRIQVDGSSAAPK